MQIKRLAGPAGRSLAVSATRGRIDSSMGRARVTPVAFKKCRREEWLSKFM
ncbi:hypothetical protein OAL09_05365 [Verrucomicrobia bacterium]|nr:hypothetical protein [Verrucomicrobiota bacterium]